MPSKVIIAREAASLIRDGDTVAILGSGGGVAEPTRLLRALRTRFLEEGHPRDLTLLHTTGLGDRREVDADPVEATKLLIGTDLLALPGLVRRDIGGHLGMSPMIARMILANEIESYNFPQGVLTQMMTAIAARKPGVFTKVGLHTYIDPRVQGGRMNAVTTEDLVRVEVRDGEAWLFFPRMHIDVALVRGTTADAKGNITSEEEPALLDGLATAQAGRACGGIVIAQVKRLAETGTLDPRDVRIPGVMVDYVVVDPDQQQTCLGAYQPAFSGEARMPLTHVPPLSLSIRKVIARRAAQELVPGAVINLGVGMPSGVAAVATEQGLIDSLTFTVEHGPVGGMPAGGVIFGVAYNPEAIIPQDRQFAFYDGGGIDVAFLGMAQFDAQGNVNVSKVGDMLAGCGGFINISQNAKKVVFCGTFTTKDLRYEVGEGRLAVREEGAIRKVVREVDQTTFSGAYARATAQDVLYVTERAVFTLTSEGVVLQEIAPGIDLERDILAQMAFRPIIAEPLRTMDRDLFV